MFLSPSSVDAVAALFFERVLLTNGAFLGYRFLLFPAGVLTSDASELSLSVVSDKTPRFSHQFLFSVSSSVAF